MKSRLEIMSDKIEIAMRQTEKDKNRIADFGMQMKKMEEKRVDAKLIDHIITMVKKQGQHLEEELYKKLDK